jgi:hypothetical protein
MHDESVVGLGFGKRLVKARLRFSDAIRPPPAGSGMCTEASGGDPKLVTKAEQRAQAELKL